MSTSHRVVAYDLYRVLEGMLFIAMNKLHDSPRREANCVEFVDLIENILDKRRGSKVTKKKKVK